MMTGIFLTVHLLYFVAQCCGPCASRDCPGDQWSVLPLPVQQLIPVWAPVFPGREESGGHLGRLFMFQIVGKICYKIKKVIAPSS